MLNEKITQLTEALVSSGYEITEINTSQNIEQIKKYGNIEFILSPSFRIENILPEEKRTQLTNILYSFGYGLLFSPDMTLGIPLAPIRMSSIKARSIAFSFKKRKHPKKIRGQSF